MIINDKGVYLNYWFKDPKGVWFLVGTSHQGGLFDCIDTFKNQDTGEYITASRRQIYNLEKKGLISWLPEQKPLNNKPQQSAQKKNKQVPSIQKNFLILKIKKCSNFEQLFVLI